MRTSVLERLSAPLCDALGWDEAVNGQQVLESLERNNIFIVALDGERQWYRYHHLFGDLLRQRAGQTLSAEKIAHDHIRASEWHEKNGEMHEAYQHAIAAEDFARAADLAEMIWEKMDETFQSAAWLRWVEKLPDDVFRTRPVLCTQIVWSMTDTGQTAKSNIWLDKAEQALELPEKELNIVERTQFDALPARIGFARTYISQVSGIPAETVKYGEEALALVPDDQPFLAAQIKAVLGSAYWGNGNLQDAAFFMQEWQENAEKAGNIIFAIASGSGLADILFLQGNLQEAKCGLEKTLVLAEQHEAARSVIANHYIGLAIFTHEMGDDETAKRYFDEGVKFAEKSTLMDTAYRIQIAQAQFWADYREFDHALEALEEARRVYAESPIPETQPVDALMARIHLQQGQLSKAKAWAKERNLSVDAEIFYLREFELLVFARVLLAEEKPKDALALLARLLDAAEGDDRTGSIIAILIVQALAYRSMGDHGSAVTSLKRALALAEPEGYLRIFVREGEALADLLQNIGSEYGQRILAAITAGQAHSSSGQDQANVHEQGGLVDPLSERELEVLHLIAEGLKNQTIADKLFISLHTVKVHAKRIYAKLEVSSRTQAVAKAKSLGILTK